jgi:hypothetical protein
MCASQAIDNVIGSKVFDAGPQGIQYPLNRDRNDTDFAMDGGDVSVRYGDSRAGTSIRYSDFSVQLPRKRLNDTCTQTRLGDFGVRGHADTVVTH